MVQEPNLNWLSDIVTDWFFDNWGEEKSIVFAGGKRLENFGPHFAYSLIDTINSAFLNSIYDRSLRFDGCGIDEEIIKTNIWLLMN